MEKFYIEGYGCSLNIGETEQIAGFLKNNGFSKIEKPEEADFIIINTCSVKMVTEQRMLSRIHFLLEKKKENAKIIVVGCLAKTNKKQIQKISKELIVLDTKLESLTNALGIKEKSFSPEIIEDKSHKKISIIPISIGCVGNCTYCATKLARGSLKSYSIKEIDKAFKRALKSSKEIWITSQDLGCYGFDTKHHLPELIKTLLKNKGNFRIRLGMMNPKHFKKIRKDLVPLFEDERLYKFLHLPVQSGSEKILKLMKRSSKSDFIEALDYVRKRVPEIRISTDIIVGFPGETENDFEESIKILRKTKPNVVNISRFGKRKGTIAEKMENQLSEKEKKARSKELTCFVREMFLEENKKMVGKVEKALVSEKAEKNGFVARTNNYSPVLVSSSFGDFVKVEIREARANFFKGRILR